MTGEERVEIGGGLQVMPECPPPRTEHDMIERLERRVDALEQRLDFVEDGLAPLEDHELGEASLG